MGKQSARPVLLVQMERRFPSVGTTIGATVQCGRTRPDQFGSTSNSCSSTTAGQVQYTGGVLEACNGISWIPIDSGMHFISTQTASNSASLQFTNLPSTYNTLFLNCTGMQPESNDDTPALQFGEGSTPTWKTASYSYGVLGLDANGGSAVNAHGTSASSINLTYSLADCGAVGGTTCGTNYSYSFNAYIYAVGSSTLTKHLVFEGVPTSDPNIQVGAGYYVGDTNPITAIRFIFAGGQNVGAGTCSLYGMN
jgi:hypothetical protein